MEQVLLSIHEAGEALGLGETKVRQLVARGLLEGVRVDGALRVVAESIRLFPDRMRQQAETEGSRQAQKSTQANAITPPRACTWSETEEATEHERVRTE